MYAQKCGAVLNAVLMFGINIWSIVEKAACIVQVHIGVGLWWCIDHVCVWTGVHCQCMLLLLVS